jgi:cell division protein FtsB
VRREVPIALAIVAAALGVAVADSKSGISTWQRVRRDLVAVEARVLELAERVEALEQEAAALERDPLALERAIREDLGLAKPGEIVVRGLGPRARPAEALHPSSAAGADPIGTPRNP